jgi:hypothetical protein
MTCFSLSPCSYVNTKRYRKYSTHPMHDHSPELDSGFRRNDVSCHAVFESVMPAKAGAFRYPGLFSGSAE